MDKQLLFTDPKVIGAQKIIDHSKFVFTSLRKARLLMVLIISGEGISILIISQFIFNIIFDFLITTIFEIVAIITAIMYFHISQIKWNLAIIFHLEKEFDIILVSNISDDNKAIIIQELFSVMIGKQKRRFTKELDSLINQYK
jgi:hypothetical protein